MRDKHKVGSEQMIIDSHCHLHDNKFAEDLDQVMERARKANISHFITIGCDIATTEKAQALSHQLNDVYFTAGFHPHEAKFLNDETYDQLKTIARDPKCVAIGECGLDYYYHHSSIDEQKAAFTRQIQLALELDLPLVIHLRDAFDDCLALLKQTEALRGKVLIHCFSGTLEEAKIFEARGFYISLSGIITFKKPGDLPMVAKTVALDKLIVETDCPYLAPHPYRGQRNEPANIVYTLEAVAQARNETVDVISQQIHENTLRFFGLA